MRCRFLVPATRLQIIVLYALIHTSSAGRTRPRRPRVHAPQALFQPHTRVSSMHAHAPVPASSTTAPVLAPIPAPAPGPRILNETALLLAREAQERDEWIEATPYGPPSGMPEALAAAAWRPPNEKERGMVMLTSGNHNALYRLLPRWLDSLMHTRDGDLTRHAVVVGLGAAAMAACRNQSRLSGHHCIKDVHWPGPDQPYRFPDDWYIATTLNKVNLIHSALVLGYSVFWVDTDVVHFGNALPYLGSLSADLAVASESCISRQYRKDNAWPEAFDLNTGTIFLRAGPPVVDFVTDWLWLQRDHLLHWGPGDFNASDMFQRRSDQVTLNKYALPRLKRAVEAGNSTMTLAVLSQGKFPNWCGGPCGCGGQQPRPASQFIRLDDEQGLLLTGRIRCPKAVVSAWLMYHVPCAGSQLEKVAILDAYQHMADRLHAGGAPPKASLRAKSVRRKTGTASQHSS